MTPFQLFLYIVAAISGLVVSAILALLFLGIVGKILKPRPKPDVVSEVLRKQRERIVTDFEKSVQEAIEKQSRRNPPS